MAESITQKIGNKSGHIFNQTIMWLKKGAQIGAVVGAVFAVGGFLAAANFATLGAGGVVMGMAAYTLFGGFGGAAAGMCSGSIFGGIKGLLTRPKPNGEQIMQEALACGKEGPGAEEFTPQHQTSQQPELQTQVSQQATGGAAGLPQQAVAELNAMTKTLNEIQANTASMSAQNAAPQTATAPGVPENWAQRVQNQPAAAEHRQR